MKRRYALFTAIFVVSLLIGIQAVDVVNADPYSYFPQIIVGFPNYDHSQPMFASKVNSILFSFDLSTTSNDLNSILITYNLDGNTTGYNGYIPNTNITKTTAHYLGGTYWVFSGNKLLTSIPNGVHNLTVYAQISKTQIASNPVRFSVNAPTPTPSPTIEPAISASPIPSKNVFASNRLAIISLAAIVAVALVSLVYFRRRKGKP
jgi:hypothetical protein